MPTPFPGMDPYIEAQGRWPDFHHEFISQCRAGINAQLPDDYVAVINERVQTIGLAQKPRAALPDVLVAREPNAPLREKSASGAVATLDPLVLPQSVKWLDEPTESYIEIFHLPEYRLVTGVEVLSPGNKVNPGRIAYLSKRQDILHHGANLVEVDLLLSGTRLSLLKPLPSDDFFAFVTRWGSHDQCSVYHWSVRAVLPVIPVPLKAPDADAHLDLAAAFNAAYDLGRYSRVLRYEQPPGLPLSPADMEWVHSTAVARRPI